MSGAWSAWSACCGDQHHTYGRKSIHRPHSPTPAVAICPICCPHMCAFARAECPLQRDCKSQRFLHLRSACSAGAAGTLKSRYPNPCSRQAPMHAPGVGDGDATAQLGAGLVLSAGCRRVLRLAALAGGGVGAHQLPGAHRGDGIRPRHGRNGAGGPQTAGKQRALPPNAPMTAERRGLCLLLPTEADHAHKHAAGYWAGRTMIEEQVVCQSRLVSSRVSRHRQSSRNTIGCLGQGETSKSAPGLGSKATLVRGSLPTENGYTNKRFDGMSLPATGWAGVGLPVGLVPWDYKGPLCSSCPNQPLQPAHNPQ